MVQITHALRDRIVVSYILDYVIVIFLIVAFSALDKAEPHHQLFSVDNISLQYPMAKPERVTPVLAGVVSCAFPLLVIVVYTMVLDGLFSRKGKAKRNYTLGQRLWQMNCGILGLGLSVAAAITITGALKNLTGKPRPDILDRCQLPDDYVQPTHKLTSSALCTGDKHILKDGFKSWPSGHSSTAFAGLGYLSLYLAGKLHILDNRGEVWKTVLVLIPVIAAAMIAVSRIMDARHHPFDVISSSLLGMLVAWIAYRQYFPSLSDVDAKGRAHDIRSWGTSPDEKTTVYDEELGQKASSPERGRTSGAGGAASIDNEGRRRQYREQMESLEERRQQAHDFRGAHNIGQNQAPTPSESLGLSNPSNNPYYSSHDGNGIELTSTGKCVAGGYSNTVTSTPLDSRYGSPGRQDTVSSMDSGRSDDHKSAITYATDSITARTQVLSPGFGKPPSSSPPRKGSIGAGGVYSEIPGKDVITISSPPRRGTTNV